MVQFGHIPSWFVFLGLALFGVLARFGFSLGFVGPGGVVVFSPFPSWELRSWFCRGVEEQVS